MFEASLGYLMDSKLARPLTEFTIVCTIDLFIVAPILSKDGFPAAAAGAHLHGVIPLKKKKLWAALSCGPERTGSCYPHGLKP